MDRSSPHASVQYIVRVTKTLYGEVPRNRREIKSRTTTIPIVEMTMWKYCNSKESLPKKPRVKLGTGHEKPRSR